MSARKMRGEGVMQKNRKPKRKDVLARGMRTLVGSTATVLAAVEALPVWTVHTSGAQLEVTVDLPSGRRGRMTVRCSSGPDARAIGAAVSWWAERQPHRDLAELVTYCVNERAWAVAAQRRRRFGRAFEGSHAFTQPWRGAW